MDADALLRGILRSVKYEAWRLSSGSIRREELAQAALIAVWEAMPRYDPARAAFSTFANRRIRGAMIDHIRSVRERLDIVDDVRVEWIPETVQPVGIEERHQALDTAVIALPPRHAQIIRLVYEEGRNWIECGEALGITASGAHRAHTRALAWLRKRLA